MPLAAAGFGAYFGSILSQKNKYENDFRIDMQYLIYANSILFGLLNSLYSLKQQFIASPEIIKEMNILKEEKNSCLEVYLKKNSFDDISKRFNKFNYIKKQILQAEYIFPINEENLKILVETNLNIFNLILSCKESLDTLNCIIKELNSHLHLAEIDMVRYLKPDSQYYLKWYELRLSFHTNVDDCINNINLLIKCLNKSGKILSTNNKKIKFQPIVINNIDKNLQPKTSNLHPQLVEWVEN